MTGRPIGQLTGDAIGRLTRLLAHQGGWDELVLLAGPIVVVAVLIFMARRRRDDE